MKNEECPDEVRRQYTQKVTLCPPLVSGKCNEHWRRRGVPRALRKPPMVNHRIFCRAAIAVEIRGCVFIVCQILVLFVSFAFPLCANHKQPLARFVARLVHEFMSAKISFTLVLFLDIFFTSGAVLHSGTYHSVWGKVRLFQELVKAKFSLRKLSFIGCAGFFPILVYFVESFFTSGALVAWLTLNSRWRSRRCSSCSRCAPSASLCREGECSPFQN